MPVLSPGGINLEGLAYVVEPGPDGRNCLVGRKVLMP